MTILLMQTFLLLLGAFLLGTSLACVMRRAIYGSREVAVPANSSSLAPTTVAAPKAVDTDRFGRALSGEPGPTVPPVFSGQPIVEVQPLPAPPQVDTPPVASAPEPALAPVPEREPVREPVPEPEPGPAAVAEPEPVAEVAPPAPEPAPAPPAKKESAEPYHGESYAQIAVAAAATALAARARAEAEAAERLAAADQITEPEPQFEPVAEATVEEPAEAETQVESVAAQEEPVLELDELEADTLPGIDAPVAEAGDATETLVAGPIDDLARIRGIDPDTKDRLIRYGVHQFAAIAAWTPDDVRNVSQTLGFQGRIERENWIEQAQILAAGRDTDYSRKLADVAIAAAPVEGDRLHRIIGVDPESEAVLRSNGITHLAQIAAWLDADVAEAEALLGMPGRISRENWVEQARFLTRGLSPEAVFAPAVAVEAPSVAFEAAGIERVRQEGAGDPTDVPAAAHAEPEAPSDQPEFSGPSEIPGRDEGYAGLRSVRSEALRGGHAHDFGSGAIDDLKRIRGIGVLIEKKLNSLGITSYEQVANWTGADVDRISQLLDFKGRIERENWIEQARILASGGQTEFSRRADRGEV